MRNRYLLGAGVALAVALSWADARAQLLAMPSGPGALYFGILRAFCSQGTLSAWKRKESASA